MKKTNYLFLIGLMLFSVLSVNAQYKTERSAEVKRLLEEAEVADSTLIISLEDAIKIALSENTSVRVADKEVEKTGYAKQGSYSSLFPQISATGNYQRVIKKQVMYMDFEMPSMPGANPGTGGTGTGGTGTGGTGTGSTGSSSPKSNNGIEIGRSNTYSAGFSANMALVNAQAWQGIKISGLNVELAVEKARASRIDMVGEVKKAYYSILFSKEAFNVYKDVYENAVENYNNTKARYDVQKASELDYLRAKTTVSNAIPNVYNAESTVILALWQLKAVLGIDLDMDIDVLGSLDDFSTEMFRDINENADFTLDKNSTLKQLEIQTMQLAENIKLQKYAYIPTLGVAFSYTMNAMENEFDFAQYNWTPYSYVGLSLSIPIFSGGKRYNDVRQAKSQYEQVKLQSVDTERRLKIAVKQGLTTMETNMKTYYAAKESVDMAQKGYDIAEETYRVGRGTIIELNDAQLALTQAKLGCSQAIYNFVTAKTQLEQTLGQDFINE